jgi:hypothetical protein
LGKANISLDKRTISTRSRRWRQSLARLAAASVLVGVGLTAVVHPRPAYADAHAPPPFPANCPLGQAPPPGYPNPPPSSPWTYPVDNPILSTTAIPVPDQNFSDWGAPGPNGFKPITVGQKYGPGPIPYLAPFKGLMVAGTIQFLTDNPAVPKVVIPNLYASVCGTAAVPELTGTLPSSDVELATPNVYVGGLEAIPISASFGSAGHPLEANILPQPAHNGGIDAQLAGSANAAVNTLGLSCAISLNANFTTLEGQPITGPPTDGYAVVEDDNIPVPPLTASPSCPPAIAQTFNKLLGLTSGDGTASLVAPFCFDFELNGTFSATPSQRCPWPS